MRRQAKAPSAFTFGRSALAGLLAFAALLAIAPAATASKAVDSFFGNPSSSTGNTGGLFNTPRGVAVNDDSGDIYVVDGSNHRVQQFDEDGEFIRAWGRDVVISGKPNDDGTQPEICDTTAGNVAADCKNGITSPGAPGGGFNSPQGISVNSTTGHVYVSDGSFLRVQEFTATGQFVRAWGRDVVATGPNNDGPSEVQSLSVKATSGNFTLSFGGQTTASLAFDAPASGAGSVEAALNALSTIGGVGGSVAVTGGPGDATGSSPYEVTFGDALLGTDVAQITVNTSGLGIAVGTELTCTGGPSSGSTAGTLDYQWLRNGTAIGGATSASYTTVAGDEGAVLQCQVIAKNASAGATQVSAPSVAGLTVVSPHPGTTPPTTTQSSISTPAQTATLSVGTSGQELTCNAGTWAGSPTSYTYQWYRSGVPLGAPVTTAATSSKYTVTGGDLATPAAFQCSVTATNAAGSSTLASGNRTTSPSPSDPSTPTATSVLTPLSAGSTTSQGVGVFEVCVAADGDVCKAGLAGTLGGHFGSSMNGYLAVAPPAAPNAGNVVVADSANRRVQEFTASGSFVRAFGSDVALPTGSEAFEVCTSASECTIGTQTNAIDGFTSNEPRRVAVDASGAIYAGQTNSNHRVQKFSPQAGSPSLSPSLFASELLSEEGAQWAVSDLAVDASNGHVFAVKRTGGIPLRACPDPFLFGERRVLELDSAGNLVDTHAACARLNTVNGLAQRSSNGRLYIASQSYFPFGSTVSANGHRVYDLRDVPNPVAQVDPPTAVTPTSATFNGKVNPNGHPAFFHYQYKLSSDPNVPSSWTSVPEIATSAGSGSVLAPVPTQAVTGLLPERSYDVRVVAYTEFGIGRAVSAPLTFVTNPNAPEVIDQELTAHQDGPGAVRLVGRVMPGLAATDYRFEYGTDTGYGNQVGGSIFGGVEATDSPVRVSELVSGLQQGVTYHFRLVAMNAAGEDTSVDGVFRLVDQAPIDDAERVYEMVSPPDKNGQGAEPSIELFGIGKGNAVARDGNAASWYSNQSFANVEYGAGQFQAGYISFRGPDGWRTEGIQPFKEFGGSQPSGLMQDHFWSADLSRMIFRGGGFPTPQTTHNNGDTHLREPGGHIRWLYGVTSTNFPGPVWGTPSLDRFVTSTEVVLSDEPGIPDASVGKVYEWSADRAANNGFKLASIMPDGSPATATARAGSAKQEQSVHRAMSADGNHIFFSTPALTAFTPPEPPDSAKIYRRSFGATTKLVSPSKRSAPDPQGEKAKHYWTSTPDQSPSGPAAVFFTSAELLTDDANTGPTRAGSELYRYQINSDELTAISAETNTTDGARVVGVIDVSDDGKWVYYVALGEVVAGQGVVGQPNIYVWHDDGSANGTNSFVATLDGQECDPSEVPDDDGCNYWHGEGEGPLPGKYEHERSARVSRDGRRLVFQSRRPLTGYDNFGPECVSLQSGEEVPGNCPQIFLYEADGAAGAGQLTCITCPAGGEPGQEQMSPPSSPPGRTPVGDPARFVSDDGRRIFFRSETPYVPRDDNGHADIYEWEDGEYSLISTGRANHDAEWIGASSSGRDVFFTTREQLDPYRNDVDGVADVYDARVGGGFGPVEQPPLLCTGEDCKTVADPQPDYPLPATAGVVGRGNVATAAQKCGRRSGQAKRLKTQAKRLRTKAKRALSEAASTRLQRRSRRAADAAKRIGRKAASCRRSSRRASR